MKNVRISVAMATYNGEKYIYDQLNSIIKCLGKDDEIIISDDGSTDNTINIIKQFKDKRIKIFNGPKKGVIKNFENAISKCLGKYIFLSDQDDIWNKNKIEKILKEFEKDSTLTLVMHDAIVKNADLSQKIFDSFFEFRKCKTGYFNNLYKNSYIGCCIAFKSEILKYILPFPIGIPMHDQWIGLMNELIGKSRFINDKLIEYRRHDMNVSNFDRNNLLVMIKNRKILAIETYRRYKKCKIK